ncbi:hypothetical protein [Pelagibacterium limicola]|uniref:hypothetical protein n=1 Tax=Pelagibacterium limicola TaxID=2791022 RepID=UPI0018AFA461|nr:hypothetical protein [Pelagibacterium limicola]
MNHSTRSVLREIGAAVAVLSIYVLTLLMPLHQAAATQRGFAELGYETIAGWSVCTVAKGAEKDSDTPAAVNCPVTGVTKYDLAPHVDPATPLIVPAMEAIRYGALALGHPKGTRHSDGHPRAPPVAV